MLLLFKQRPAPIEVAGTLAFDRIGANHNWVNDFACIIVDITVVKTNNLQIHLQMMMESGDK